MASGLRIRLSVMMFLQYAIWGAWSPFLWRILTAPKADGGLAMTDVQAGWIFGLLWLACILAPFTGGQIADRWVPTQRFLGVAQLAGAVLLFMASRSTTFTTMNWIMAAYCLLYAPTLALTNSLAFHHLGDQKDFGRIRVWGTIGWIFAELILGGWRLIGTPARTVDCLMLAAFFSLVMGAYAFFLPHTPPAKDKATDPLAFRKAFVLLKNTNFLVFMLIAFVVTTELQFYYGPTEEFLVRGLRINPAYTPWIMPVAQAAEIIAMAFLLPVALRKWGLRRTLAVGVIAWPLRYVVFALAPLGAVDVTRLVVVASLTLHGLGYTFFFVASQIFVDMVASKDIRASAQSLLTLVTLGLGNWLGTQFTGAVKNYFRPQDNPANWTYFFLVPCALTILCALAFLVFFKDPEEKKISKTEQARVQV